MSIADEISSISTKAQRRIRKSEEAKQRQEEVAAARAKRKREQDLKKFYPKLLDLIRDKASEGAKKYWMHADWETYQVLAPLLQTDGFTIQWDSGSRTVEGSRNGIPYRETRDDGFTGFTVQWK